MLVAFAVHGLFWALTNCARDPESRVRYILGAHGRSSAGGCTVPGTELGLAR